ncbi:hypothetical protein CDEF62S_01534 [Castellaniella defragrans]
MQEGHELGQPPVRLDEARRHFLGMGSRVADAFDSRDIVDVIQQHGEVGHFARVAGGAPVGVDVLAQQGDFAHALVGQVGDLGEHVVEGPGNFGAASVGHHAEAAVFAAAFHDGNEGRGAGDVCRRQGIEFFDRRKRDVDLRPAGLAAAVDELRQAVQRLRAEHHVHVRGAADDGFAFLAGHASAHANDEVGIFVLQMMHAAQVREDFLLRLLAHRTGIEQDDVGVFGGLGELHSLRGAQDVRHLFRIVFIHLAAEGPDEELLVLARLGGLQDLG